MVMRQDSVKFWFWSILAVAIMLLLADVAQASDAGAGAATGLQWESPIEKFRRSISGPVAFGASLAGLVVAGIALIWGGEIGDFTRRIFYLVLVISVVVFGNSILTGTLWAGAIIPDGIVIDVHDSGGNAG